MQQSIFSVRLCRDAAVGESPITCQPLCAPHLQIDTAEAAETEEKVAKRIEYLKRHQKPMRLMQQRLASDLQLLDDTFSDLRETLDRCQSELIGTITKQHDKLMDSLTSLSELDDFEKELKQANEQKNARQAFLINRSMERSLRNFKLDSIVNIIAYPDVNFRVKELRNCIRSELTLLKKFLEQSIVSGDELPEAMNLQASESRRYARFREGESPRCLTVCTNTSGFAYSDSGIIYKSGASPLCSQLPQPLILVAVEVSASSEGRVKKNSSASALSEANTFRIVALSAEAEILGNLSCSWEPKQLIRDLHCDNERQQLYIAQHNSVTVTDLSGALKTKILMSDVKHRAVGLYCITGDNDSLFALFLKDFYDDVSLVKVCKDSGEVQMEMSICTSPELGEPLVGLTHMETRDRMVFVSNQKTVFTICLITGLVVGSRPLQDRSFIMEGLSNTDCEPIFAITCKKLTSTEFRLAGCASHLSVVPALTEPLYFLSSDGETQCQLVQVEHGKVVFMTWRLEYVSDEPLEYETGDPREDGPKVSCSQTLKDIGKKSKK